VLSIIYAFRNRDTHRIQASLESLANQSHHLNFEVVFVDYGSEMQYFKPIKKLVQKFYFAHFFSIGHSGLLWCKARALNYAFTKTRHDNIFVADADVVFHKDFFSHVINLDVSNAFYLFDIAYLSKDLGVKEVMNSSFSDRMSTHIHTTFGVSLFPKRGIERVGGLDAFFHFYGSEDEDLNRRLMNAGYQKIKAEGLYLQHIWHERYPQPKDNMLTQEPRLRQIMRINQAHMLTNDRREITSTSRGIEDVNYYSKEDLQRLDKPLAKIQISNKQAEVDMWLRLHIEEMVTEHGIVQFEFVSEATPKTAKYKIKQKLGKSITLYYTMKEVNDLLLKQVIYKWHNHNYKLEIQAEEERILFTLEKLYS